MAGGQMAGGRGIWGLHGGAAWLGAGVYGDRGKWGPRYMGNGVYGAWDIWASSVWGRMAGDRDVWEYRDRMSGDGDIWGHVHLVTRDVGEHLKVHPQGGRVVGEG